MRLDNIPITPLPTNRIRTLLVGAEALKYIEGKEGYQFLGCKLKLRKNLFLTGRIFDMYVVESTKQEPSIIYGLPRGWLSNLVCSVLSDAMGKRK